MAAKNQTSHTVAVFARGIVERGTTGSKESAAETISNATPGSEVLVTVGMGVTTPSPFSRGEVYVWVRVRGTNTDVGDRFYGEWSKREDAARTFIRKWVKTAWARNDQKYFRERGMR